MDSKRMLAEQCSPTSHQITPPILSSQYSVFHDPLRSSSIDYSFCCKPSNDPSELIQIAAEIEQLSAHDGALEEDSETKSDAGTCNICNFVGIDDDDDDDFCKESVKQKIEILAEMVGIKGCVEPATVLANVVKVLRGLNRWKDFTPLFRPA